MTSIANLNAVSVLTQDAAFVVDNAPNTNPSTVKITLASLINNVVPGPYANNSAMLAANTVQIGQPFYYSNGMIVVRIS